MINKLQYHLRMSLNNLRGPPLLIISDLVLISERWRLGEKNGCHFILTDDMVGSISAALSSPVFCSWKSSLMIWPNWPNLQKNKTKQKKKTADENWPNIYKICGSVTTDFFFFFTWADFHRPLRPTLTKSEIDRQIVRCNLALTDPLEPTLIGPTNRIISVCLNIISFIASIDRFLSSFLTGTLLSRSVK